MAKFPEAMARIISGVFICKKCKHKKKAPIIKVTQNKIPCRNCKRKTLRPIRKK